MAVIIERDGGDNLKVAPPSHRRTSSRRRHQRSHGWGTELVRGNDGTPVEGTIIGDVRFIEGQGVLGQHHIAIDGIGGCRDPRAIAPEVLFDFLRGAVGLLLIGRALDAHATLRVIYGLALLAIEVTHRLARIVLAYPGIDVLDIEGHYFAQTGNVVLQGMHRGMQERLEQLLIEGTQFLAQPETHGSVCWTSKP